MKSYINKLQSFITNRLNILKENKYLKKIIYNHDTVLERLPNILKQKKYNYDHNLITIAVNNLYLKTVLTNIKKEIMEKYEKENIRLKEIENSNKLRHTSEHTKTLRNSEKLLLNIHVIDNALLQVEDSQKEIKDHVEKVLQLLPLEK